jgi:3-oxoacyl-[acyl-carrier protein] reductase
MYWTRRATRLDSRTMDLQLTGHRAVVTGSSSGLGEAIARRLSAEGAAVIVHGRRAEAVHAVVESIRAEGGQAMAALANLADARECTEFVSAAQAAGPVDILINNAGAYANRSWEDASPEDWLELYAINVAAVVRCVQGFVPDMRGGGWGRIIQIGTGEAINPFPTMPDYAAAKAALLNLTVSLSKYLARSGITVNTVSPGIVVTPGVEQFYRQEASRRGWGSDWEAIEAGVLAEILDNPVGRLGQPSEVADLVAFVASPLAGYINGANLRIDGGSTAVI